MAFLSSSSTLFEAPATLITVQALLFVQVQYIGFILVAILLAAGTAQAFLYKRIITIGGAKAGIMGKRVLCNL